MQNFSKKTLKSYRDNDTWIKVINSCNFDAIEYNKFYNYIGYQFLPKLLHFEENHNEQKLILEYIEGKKPTLSHIDSFIRFLSYKIIPAFIEWSRLRKRETTLHAERPPFNEELWRNEIYFHVDLKLDNFLLTTDKKLYMIDVDSICYTNFDFFDVILDKIYAEDRKFIKNS